MTGWILCALTGAILVAALRKLHIAQRQLVLRILGETGPMLGSRILRLSAGSIHAIYIVLSDLERDGLVTSEKDPNDPYGRKRYQLSAAVQARRKALQAWEGWTEADVQTERKGIDSLR